MPWSGGGAFTRTNGFNTGAGVWALDKAGGIKIVASRHDTHDQDLATGINAALAKNGENAATGNLNLGAFRFTNAGNAVADMDLVTLGQAKSTLGAPTGTKLLFPATAAVPSGWSIDTTGAFDDAAIRIRTAGSTATGGDQGFTTAFAAGRASNAYTLQTADIPAHAHGPGSHTHDMAHTHTITVVQSLSGDGPSGGPNTFAGPVQVGASTSGSSAANTGTPSASNTANAGGGGSHSHDLPSFAVKYVDSVIGVKS